MAPSQLSEDAILRSKLGNHARVRQCHNNVPTRPDMLCADKLVVGKGVWDWVQYLLPPLFIEADGGRDDSRM